MLRALWSVTLEHAGAGPLCLRCPSRCPRLGPALEPQARLSLAAHWELAQWADRAGWAAQSLGSYSAARVGARPSGSAGEGGRARDPVSSPAQTAMPRRQVQAASILASQAAEDLATSATPCGPPLVEREGVWPIRLQALAHLLWGASYQFQEFLDAAMAQSPAAWRV